MTSMNQFDRLETIAQRLIEGAFSRLFHTQLHPADLARYLAIAIESEPPETGQSEADHIPNFYGVILNPGDYNQLVAGSSVEAEATRLRNYLTWLIQEADYQPAGPIHVTLEPSDGVRPGKVKVKTRYVNGNGSKHRTKTKEAFFVSTTNAGHWLLQFEDNVVSLGEPVLRIGRALDNDIILTDQTVSRYHAQLRWRNGGYHLYPPVPPEVVGEQDKTLRLDPRTTVNAEAATQGALKHGDVLTFGSTVLHIVVQDNP
ncbi:MAG: DUF3662 domain-containing protein [Anaerolineae bacterium]|nr:DUF3662 domain-containing protein [Anaerolineae bacterium]